MNAARSPGRIPRFCLLPLLLFLSLRPAPAMAGYSFRVQGPNPEQNRAFGKRLETLSGGRWQAQPKDPDVLVSLGDAAFAAALREPGSAPVLGVAVTRPLAASRIGEGCHCSAIWQGVPLSRQLRLLHAMMPAVRTVGVLLGPDSAWEPPPPGMDGIALQAVWVDDAQRLGQQLRRCLPHWDALLLPADRTLFDAGAAKLILLTSYRQRVPVFGPGAGYVRAGSVASLHASAEDLAQATLDRLETWRTQGRLPPPAFAGHYSLSINEHVAQAYDLIVQDRTALKRMLEKTP